ncbi:MAG TPA: arginine--tRNA ligase [bacterium]|nr:arginine--tRNA ligase [bacterium]HPN36046.1 arginine--tRNA ligase [bacterium]
MNPQEYIRNQIQSALAQLAIPVSDIKQLNLEKPKQEAYGDLATAIAMNLAKEQKRAPRKLAEQIVSRLNLDPLYVEKAEIAGPGFINFYLAKHCLQQSVSSIVQQGAEYGRSQWGQGRSIQLEFVSANPTGPLNIVSARAAAIGDVLANCFALCGFDARREFYVNDAGRQIRLLGRSLSSRYLTALGNEQPVPEDGYHGLYLQDLALEILQRDGDRYADLSEEERDARFSALALEYMLERQKSSLDKYGVHYDLWFRESRLREGQAHRAVLEKLEKAGLSYHQDGALWFQSSKFGDEKDRVLITSAGEPTYFLIDIAYHQNKYERGFDQIIDFWGPDHHGYIDRMRAALLALGHPADSFQVSIIQQVNLLRNGQPVKMSKRAGEIIEMDELVEEVGVDASRFFFVDRRISQPLDFDIELAKKQTDENPVYYVQYAHARICNVLRYAQEQGRTLPEQADVSRLENEFELQLIKKLIDYPEVIARAAQYLEPHRIPDYLQELATVFHRFYHENRVVIDDEELSNARLLLCQAARLVLANGLKILGISAPETM